MARALVQPVSQLVDPDHEPGELALRYGAGRPCLDLVLTVGERWRRSFERLRTPEDLAAWLVGAKLAPEPPAVTRRDLEAARELREAIFRIARAAMDRRPANPANLSQVNAWAARPDAVPQLAGIGRATRISPRGPVTAALATVARDAVDLFGSPLSARVHECAAPDCSGIFLDASRAGGRRWCSMARCGNRTKVAAHRSRRSGPSSHPDPMRAATPAPTTRRNPT